MTRPALSALSSRRRLLGRGWGLAGGVLSLLLAAARAQPAAAPAIDDAALPVEKIEAAERLLAAGDISGATRASVEALDLLLEALRGRGERQAIPEAEVLLRRLGLLAGAGGAGADTLAAWRRWAEADLPAEASGCVFAARLELGMALPGESAALWQPLGLLERWRVVGPFDNDRGGSFLTPLGPEKSATEGEAPSGRSLDATYDGKARPVGWRELPARPVAGRVDLAALFRPSEEALAYALTWVRSAGAQDAALRFGSDDGFRVWVNGALVASGDIQRSFRHDQNAVPVRLRAGWNSIVFKVTQSKSAWELAARLTRLDGGALAGVEEGLPEEAPAEGIVPSLEAEPRTPEAPREGEPGAGGALAVSPGSEEILRARIESQPGDARAHYLLGTLLRLRAAHDANEHPDRELLERAVSIDDRPAIYHLELARSHEQETAIAAQKEENAWRQALEEADRRSCAVAAYELARYYQRTFGNSRTARSYLDRALEANPHLADAVRLEGEIEAALGFPRAREDARARLFALAELNLHGRLEKARALRARGRAEEAAAVLAEVVAAAPRWREARLELALAIAALERFDEAVRVLAEGAALHPFAIEWHLELARLHEGRDDIDAALSAIARALTIAPEDEALEERRAGLLLRAGRRPEALAALARSLEIQPNQPHVREYLDFLETRSSGFEERFRRDAAPIAKSAWEAPAEAAAGDPARVLLDLRAIHVNADGTTKELVQLVLQVLNDRGIRMHDHFRAPYAEGDQVLEFERARVLRPDGKEEEARLSRFGSGRDAGGGGGPSDFGSHRLASVDLPPLAALDVVEIQYLREDLVQGFFGDYFGHREVFRSSLPIKEKVLVLEVPAGREFYFHQRHLGLEPEKESDDAAGITRYTWRLTDLAKLDPEPAMAPLREVAPILEVSTFRDWNAFNAWYWNLVRKQYETSPEIAKKVMELTSGATTDLEKIRALYNFVVTDIRYNDAWEFGVHGFKPYNAASIFARRFGDCKDKATILKVLLREAGIESHPVLIRMEPLRGEEDLTLPMFDHFNHCISYLPAAGDRPEMFLDGTAQSYSFDTLPSPDCGARVLIVKDGDAVIRETPWNLPADISFEEETVVDLRPDLGAALVTRVRARGDYAVRVRRSYEIAAQRRTELERLYAARHAAARVTGETFSDLKNLDQPVAFRVDVEVPRLVTEAPEGLVLKTPEDFFSSGRSLALFGSIEKRTSDLLLGNPRRSLLRVEYRLPAGVRVKSLPSEHDLATRFGRLRVTYRADGPALVTEQLVELTTHRVPAADYGQFREFAARIDRLADERILLERGEAPR